MKVYLCESVGIIDGTINLYNERGSWNIKELNGESWRHIDKNMVFFTLICMDT